MIVEEWIPGLAGDFIQAELNADGFRKVRNKAVQVEPNKFDIP